MGRLVPKIVRENEVVYPLFRFLTVSVTYSVFLLFSFWNISIALSFLKYYCFFYKYLITNKQFSIFCCLALTITLLTILKKNIAFPRKGTRILAKITHKNAVYVVVQYTCSAYLSKKSICTHHY